MKPLSISIIISVGVTLLFFFSQSVQAQSTIDVPCNTADFVAALNLANSTPEADTLHLAANCVYTFTSASDIDKDNGNSALPRITTPLTINGNSATIERASGAPEFRLLFVGPRGNLTLNRIGLTGGFVDDKYGGAVYNQGTVAILNSTISGNQGYSGGGMYNTGPLTIINAVFSNNQAAQGGGLYHETNTATIINALFSGNLASSGGGLAIAGTAIMTNTTIAGNNANGPRMGGGISNAGTATLTNSIVWGNSTQIAGAGSTTINYSIVEGGGFAGMGNRTDDPLFIGSDPFASAPTNAGDYHLQANSPAINTGDNAAMPADAFDLDGDGDIGEPVPYDLDNHARFHEMVDIGAYETDPCLPYPSPYTVPAGDTAALVQAIVCANVNPDSTIINLTTSTYTFTSASTSDASSALPHITTPIIINGNGAIIERASIAPNFRLLQNANGGHLTLDHVTVQGGVESGGGINNNHGTLIVANSTISGNSAGNGCGGGIANSLGTVTITSSTLSGNSAESSNCGGGGIWNTGILTMTGSTLTGNSSSIGGAIGNQRGQLAVINSTLSGNNAGIGGGIYNIKGTMTVSQSTISGNSTTGLGAGIANRNNSTMIVTGSIVSGNSLTANNSGGGGISNAGILTVINTTVSGNTVAGGSNGGGIHHGEGTLTVINSTIAGNSADDGGGMYMEDRYNTDNLMATLVNILISGNSARSEGGGLMVVEGPTSIANSTIAGNNASIGGGLNTGTNPLTVTNSIVWGNNGQILATGATVTYSTVENGYAGEDNLSADPQFVNPAAYTSAPTTSGNYQLQAGSPAIDAGSRAALPTDGIDLDGDGATDEPIPYDLSGNERVMRATVDMGAYEQQATTYQVYLPLARGT